MTTLKHLKTITSFTKSEITCIISKAMELKANPGAFREAAQDKTILLLFQKPSLRTRVSFETGMTQLGGHAIFYPNQFSPLGSKESTSDTAKVLSRYVDVICARVYDRKMIDDLAKHATVPVINMLDDFAHPCQIMCDFMTLQEKKNNLSDLKLVFYGDGYNNVTNDLMRMSALFGIEMVVACPEGKEYEPEKAVLDEVAAISERTGAKVYIEHDPKKATCNADVLYTDSWMSYGIPKEEEAKRRAVFGPYQVTSEILALAKPDAIFMNCLPADRTAEQTAEVIDGPQSIVFDQAENRLHVQKAIILYLLNVFSEQ